MIDFSINPPVFWQHAGTLIKWTIFLSNVVLVHIFVSEFPLHRIVNSQELTFSIQLNITMSEYWIYSQDSKGMNIEYHKAIMQSVSSKLSECIFSWHQKWLLFTWANEMVNRYKRPARNHLLLMCWMDGFQLLLEELWLLSYCHNNPPSDSINMSNQRIFW